MNDALGTGPSEPVRSAPSIDPSYRPAVDEHAQRLIARIQRNHNDNRAVTELAAHYEKHGDLPSLANLMEGWATTLREDHNAADAYVRAADAVLLGLGDRTRAQALFQSALKRQPEHGPALVKLEMLLREAGDDTGIERCFSQVLDDLARRGGKTSVRADLHLRLGQHYEHRLILPGRAIAQYRAALELDATLIAAITAARGIYLNSGKGEAAADMFELQVGATADLGQRHALLVQLAKHRREVLGDLDGAVLVLRRALKAMPNDSTTLEQLADLLRERADQADGPNADADRGRAAELYFQVARSVPRGQARPHLHACLELSPAHRRARHMLAELSAYGAGGEQPVQAGVPQAELDSRSTGKHTPLPGDGANERPTSPPPGTLAAAGDGADQEVAAWLDDADITMIDDAVTTDSVVPLTDRPPAPDGPPPRIPTLRGR